MRKHIFHKQSQEAAPEEFNWLDLEKLAQIELTSEDPDFPIESALIPHQGSGWRASQPGEQTIRLVFDEPQTIKHIRLAIQEDLDERTQEFVFRWLPAGNQSYREIVRQQYNFSPPGAALEVENYAVNLDQVVALELKIVPDISGGHATAKLAQLRLA